MMKRQQARAGDLAKGLLVATMIGMVPIVTQAIATPSVAYAEETTVSTAEEFMNTLDSAQDGDVIVLSSDIDLTAPSNYSNGGNTRIPIGKSVTINGNNHTITVKNRGFGVGMGASSNIDVTFKDVTIQNSASSGRCVDTRGHIGTLTLDHTVLSTQGASSGYTQPLTIGGRQDSAATINICNGSVIKTNDDATNYYAIITFNPVNVTIDNSTLMGWACIYAKAPDGSAGSAGSVYNITNSTLMSKNKNSGETNAFSAIMLEDSNITINISDSTLDISATGDQNQAIVSLQKGSDCQGNVVSLGSGNIVTLNGENAVFENNTDEILQISGGAFSKVVPSYCAADGYDPTDAVLDIENHRYTVAQPVETTPDEATADKAYLQISETDDSGSQTYKVYRLFNADITEDAQNGNKLASNISWNEGTKDFVQSFLAQYDGDKDGVIDYIKWLSDNGHGTTDADIESAQNAAEFIAASIATSPTAVDATQTVPRSTTGTSFANDLAFVLANFGAPTVGRVKSGAVLELPTQGYYLVTSDSDTIADGTVGTAPIWLPWAATTTPENITTITPKVALPTLSKTVKEGNAYGKIADANRGTDVEFKIVATLPSNYGAYGYYDLIITDSIPAGLTLKGQPTVSHASSDVAEALLAAADFFEIPAGDAATAQTMTIGWLDLTEITGLSAGDEIVITYTATVDDDALSGTDSLNTNTATMTYTNDPNSMFSTSDITDSTSVATYELVLEKLDKGTKAPMPGVEFTIQKDDANGQYVDADGYLGNVAVTHTTDQYGKIAIDGLDAGTYYIVETTPTGYKAMAPMYVAITADKSASISLGASVSGGNVGTAISTPDANATDGLTGIDNDGTISVRISNVKEIILPITGMTPSQLATVLGVALLASGTILAVGYVDQSRRRK